MELVESSQFAILPLVGVYGKSGSGKTHSALLLAIGISRALYGAGTRRVGIIDTERKRSTVIFDLLPERPMLLDLEEPFSPERYTEAITVLEDKPVGCGVIDSMTHEWSGEGGILDWQEKELTRMAGEDYRKRESCKMASWIAPKIAHKKMVQRILRSSVPLVCCLRADEKVHMERGDGDKKTRVITDEFTTPDFDKKFIFEMLCNLEIVQVGDLPGCCRVRKWSHPDIKKLLPKEGEQVTVQHGEALGQWCKRSIGTKEPTAMAPRGADSKATAALKKKLWEVTKSVHHETARILEQWLWDENIMHDTRSLADATDAELRQYIEKAEKQLRK